MSLQSLLLSFPSLYSHVGGLPFPCVTGEVTSSPPKKKGARPRAQTGGKGAPPLLMGGRATESWGLEKKNAGGMFRLGMHVGWLRKMCGVGLSAPLIW